MLQSILGACFTRQEAQHYLLAGVEGVGKTTLLYRLKAPSTLSFQQLADSIGEINETRDGKVASADEEEKPLDAKSQEEGPPKGPKWTYHFEMFDGYGVWDFPGSLSVSELLPTVYRSVYMTAVLFVVDCDDLREPQSDEEKLLLQARLDRSARLLRFLLYEDELRSAAFCVLVNEHKAQAHHFHNKSSHGKANEGRRAPEQYDLNENRYYYELNIDELEREDPAIESRLKLFTLDCAALQHRDRDPKWKSILEHINRVAAKAAKKKK
jgi:hypothetical protein